MIRANISTFLSHLHAETAAFHGSVLRALRGGALLLLMLCGFAMTACSSDDTTDPVYDNWAARNDAAFADTMRTARAAIAQARATYGDNWAAHTPWRVFPNYTLGTGGSPKASDSLVVRVVSSELSAEAALTAPRPLYTDTVRVAYMGRLMPTSADPAGKVFDFSGPSRLESDVFNPTLGTAAKLPVSNLVVGFTTALQQMHVGDRWRIFIPARSGYGNQAQKTIPAGSMLIFDLQLRQFWRAF